MTWFLTQTDTECVLMLHGDSGYWLYLECAPEIQSLWCASRRPVSCSPPSSCSAMFISSITSQNFSPVCVKMFLISQSKAGYYHCCHNTKRRRHAPLPCHLLAWVISLMVKMNFLCKKKHMVTKYIVLGQKLAQFKTFAFFSWRMTDKKNGHLLHLSSPVMTASDGMVSWFIHRSLLEISPCQLVPQ